MSAPRSPQCHYRFCPCQKIGFSGSLPAKSCIGQGFFTNRFNKRDSESFFIRSIGPMFYKPIEPLPGRSQAGAQKGGGGSSPRSLSQLPPLGTRSAGRRLPDATLRDMRSCRPHSGAVQRLTATELSSEAYSPAQHRVAARNLQTSQRDICKYVHLFATQHKVSHRL